MKSKQTIWAALLIAALLGYAAGHMNLVNVAQAKNKPQTDKAGLKYPLKVTLYRFQLNKDSIKIYQDWVNWHFTQHVPIVATLEREKMYVEAVFRDTVNQPDVIYWLAMNGEGGEHYNTSPLAVDKIHSAYMKRILIKGSRVILKTEFTLLPPFLEKSIREHQMNPINKP